MRKIPRRDNNISPKERSYFTRENGSKGSSDIRKGKKTAKYRKQSFKQDRAEEKHKPERKDNKLKRVNW